MIARANADQEPTAASQYRAWRINFLIGLVSVSVMYAVFAYALVMYLIVAFGI
jgi:hypothetical protein